MADNTTENNVKLLSVQNNLTKFDGVIGRKKYFINSLIISISFIPVLLILHLYRNCIKTMTPIFGDYFVFFLLFSYIFVLITWSFFNHVKRLSDIIGQRNALTYVYVVFVFIISKISIFLFVFSLFFLFKKGKITSIVNAVE